MTEATEGSDPLAWHQRLVQGLLQGSALAALSPSNKTTAPRLVQTHISSVLLAGEFAYKLRKPLRLPFLDFSTAALRRHDCEEELRLNRRTAPALYLDVLPVTGTVDAPLIGGSGEVIDWLLRMRRFDDSQQLDHLADDGRLNAAIIDALAQRVASFHAALPPSPAAWGAAGKVRDWAIENIDAIDKQLQDGPASALQRTRLVALRRWTEQHFERLAPVLESRRAAGFVREGHGDLHLGNIVRVDGEPLPFDGIEFNPALRHTDLIADMAFTFMDLQRHGQPGLAWRFVCGWADGTGDHAGLVLLPFFAVYRAMVRAKVALLRGAQGDVQAGAAFERDLSLAEALAAPRIAPPRLLLTSGLSGSGKSTLALALVETVGAVRLRSDVERKRLHGLAPSDRPDTATAALLYGAEATRRTFDHLATLAATLLRGGLDVVVDAAFLRRAERDRFRALAADCGAGFVLLECTAPEPVLHERLARRQQAGLDASDADGAVLTLQLSHREPVAAEEDALVIQTDLPTGELAQVARRLAATWRKG
jgi:uncharacterized protein